MDCPVCKEVMVVLELNEVEIDHCLACGGIWLDAGELDLLLEDSEQKERLLASFEVDEKAQEAKRKCPICLKKMNKVLCGRDKKVRIDRCREKDGIWFDKGELFEIIKMGTFRARGGSSQPAPKAFGEVDDEDSKVLNLLKDMFGDKAE